MADKATGERRIVKQMIPGGAARLPAGLARLTDSAEPARRGRRRRRGRDETDCRDDRRRRSGRRRAGRAAGLCRPSRSRATRLRPRNGSLQRERPTPAHDSWYFSDATAKGDAERRAERRRAETWRQPRASRRRKRQRRDEPDASDDAEAPAPADREPRLHGCARRRSRRCTRAPDAAPATSRPAGPVRFVWRTDAEGKFSQISPEFARCRRRRGGRCRRTHVRRCRAGLRARSEWRHRRPAGAARYLVRAAR